MAHRPRHPNPGALPTRRRTEQADRRPRRETSPTTPTTPSTTDGRQPSGDGTMNERRRPSRLSSTVLLGPRLTGCEEPPADPPFTVVADGWDPSQVGEHLAVLRS